MPTHFLRMLGDNRELAAITALVLGTLCACAMAIVLHAVAGRTRKGAFVANWVALTIYIAGLATVFLVLSDGWLSSMRTGYSRRVPLEFVWAAVAILGFIVALKWTQAIEVPREHNSEGA